MARSLRASIDGAKKAEVALERKGWTQDYLAGKADCTRQTVGKFFARRPIEKRLFQAICIGLELEWGEIAELEVGSEQVSQLSDAENSNGLLTQTVSNKLSVRRIVEDKTQNFVGREYVFQAIAQFITTQSNGYFTITGDPGMGKSAILAKYVQDNDCIAHFNEHLQGINRTEQFLDNICSQLIGRYRLPHQTLPPTATQNGEFLSQLLEEAAQGRNGNPVIIAVDALDEVDPNSYGDGNILYLPPYLPQGVYFLITRRRGVDVPFAAYTPLEFFSLLDYQEDSQRDVSRYIQKRINSSEYLHSRIDERQETVIEFTDKIAAKSENNFMYLRYVLQDIEKGEYKDLNLERFPQGLQGYYKFHWRRMGMADNPLPNAKIKIVYVLVEIGCPVSPQLISECAKENRLKVQEVLDDWKQFLHTQEIEGQTCYRIYHASFADFLHRKDIVQAANIDVRNINTLIADDLWEGLYGNE